MKPGLVLIDALLLGAVAPLPGTMLGSGIAKHPVTEPIWLSTDGLSGDQQADLRHHGGPDKALHHYPREHYAGWLRRSRRQDLLAQPGAFGENLSSKELAETHVCIGDVFQLGAATVQVSQGRQPCWKLDARFGAPGLACRMQATGATDWYYRVPTPGWVQAGDSLHLLERPHADWPLARLIALLFNCDPSLAEDWQRASELPTLASNWRGTFARRVASGQVEDWRKRLED